MAITQYIRNVDRAIRNTDRAILNTVFENTVRRVNKCLETQKLYTEHTELNIHNNKKEKNWDVWAVPRLCELCPGICLTTEKKSLKTLS
jgi:precorrin-6B methylase 2